MPYHKPLANGCQRFRQSDPGKANGLIIQGKNSRHALGFITGNSSILICQFRSLTFHLVVGICEVYNQPVSRNLSNPRWAAYAGAVLGIAAATVILAPFHTRINATTVALAFLLVVLFAALFWGSRPALLASVLAMFSFNFFFLPPLYTLDARTPRTGLR